MPGAGGAQGARGAHGAQGHQGVQGAAGSATISNNADNRVITGGSGTNLNGEANLTFEGTNLVVGTAVTISTAGNITLDKPGAGIITATKFKGDGSELTGVISGIGIGTAGGVVGYAATIVHFKGAGVTTAYYNASTGIGTVLSLIHI